MGLLRISRVEIALDEKVKNLDRFPGSLAEYCQFKKGEYEIIDTEIPTKWVYDKKQELRDFIGQGCEGLIRYHPNENSTIQSWGIPVRRKQ